MRAIRKKREGGLGLAALVVGLLAACQTSPIEPTLEFDAVAWVYSMSVLRFDPGQERGGGVQPDDLRPSPVRVSCGGFARGGSLAWARSGALALPRPTPGKLLRLRDPENIHAMARRNTARAAGVRRFDVSPD